MVVTLVIVAVAGVLLVAKAVRDVWLAMWMRRVGVRATGVVVGHDRISGDGSDTFQAVVRFTDDGGVAREFRAYGSHHKPHPPEGVPVPVVFLTDGSRSPQIALPLYNAPAVLGMLWIGGLFIAAVIFFAVVGPNRS